MKVGMRWQSNVVRMGAFNRRTPSRGVRYAQVNIGTRCPRHLLIRIACQFSGHVKQVHRQSQHQRLRQLGDGE
jgi:hypothetical protein